MRIKKIREDKGISQIELSRRTGINPTTLSRYEHGTLKPNSEVLISIAKALNVNIQSLFEGYKPVEELTELEAKVKINEGMADFTIEKLQEVLKLVEKLKNK